MQYKMYLKIYICIPLFYGYNIYIYKLRIYLRLFPQFSNRTFGVSKISVTWSYLSQLCPLQKAQEKLRDVYLNTQHHLLYML